MLTEGKDEILWNLLSKGFPQSLGVIHKELQRKPSSHASRVGREWFPLRDVPWKEVLFNFGPPRR